MNRLKSFWEKLTKKSIPFNMAGRSSYAVVSGQVTWMADNLTTYIQQGYSANDIVYSIGHITSEKIKVAPWDVYKVTDEQALKMMHKLQKQYATCDPKLTGLLNRKILDFKTKALELYTDSKLTALLQYPNQDESFSDIVAHSSISKMMLGNRYLQAVLLTEGANGGKPQELYQLPPQYTLIVNNKAYPLRAVGYQMTETGGAPIQLTREEVMHDKYYNPNYDFLGSHLYGQAPLMAAAKNLDNDNASMSRSTSSFQNGGPEKIIFVDDQRMTGDHSIEQTTALKNKIIELEGTSRKIATSGYKIGVADMGMSPVDLNILNQQKWNLIKFCNVWNFPHQLLDPSHSTYNNVKEAEKALTNRCAMPLLTSFRDNFNRKIQSDWGYKGQNIYVDFDQTVYPELQQDQGETVAWLEKCWWIPAKMRYEIQNLEVPDYLDEALLEQLLVPANLVPIEQLSTNTAEINEQMALIDQQMNGQLNGNARSNGKPVAANS